jgi:hypothetical protein
VPQFFSCRADTQAHVDDFLRELQMCDPSVVLKSYHLNFVFDLPERAVEIASSLSLDEMMHVAGRVAGGATIVATLRDCPLVANPLAFGKECVS